MGTRCLWAIRFGTVLTTRCHLIVGHVGGHEGKGLAEFPYQRIEWVAGDRREFETERADAYAWEEPERHPWFEDILAGSS